MKDHFSGRGSCWTKKYKPLKHIKPIIVKDCDAYDEDKYTIKMMKIHGIPNVRGGSFCQLELSDMNKKTIKQMIYFANNKCYKCGTKGHFGKECKKRKFSQTES